MDIPQCIADFNQGRDPERLAMKFVKMRTSPFAFLRGACHLFYQRLPIDSLPPEAPLTWLCGDLHLENFGSYKGDDRLTYFDISDFDEAAFGPCTWDLIRFLVSVHLGSRGLKLDKDESAALCRHFLDAYAAALADGKVRAIERETSAGLIRDLLDAMEKRKRPDFLDSRAPLKNKKRKLQTDGKKALPIDSRQRGWVSDFVAAFAATQGDPDFFRVIDIARRVAGTGSLGVERFVILIEGKGSPDANHLLDLKAAHPSCLLPYLESAQPAWENEAQRIVAIQQGMRAVAPAFLHAVTAGGQPYVLRALLPSENRVALEENSTGMKDMIVLLCQMGRILAWDQLRSCGLRESPAAQALIAFGRRADWQVPLLELARSCCTQSEEDWREFAAAYDDGYFAKGVVFA